MTWFSRLVFQYPCQDILMNNILRINFFSNAFAVFSNAWTANGIGTKLLIFTWTDTALINRASLTLCWRSFGNELRKDDGISDNRQIVGMFAKLAFTAPGLAGRVCFFRFKPFNSRKAENFRGVWARSCCLDKSLARQREASRGYSSIWTRSLAAARFSPPHSPALLPNKCARSRCSQRADRKLFFSAARRSRSFPKAHLYLGGRLMRWNCQRTEFLRFIRKINTNF